MAIQTFSYPLPSNATEFSGWIYEPNGRGTSSILVLCVTAMLLSVWTALHINIDPQSRPWQDSIRKTGLMLVAILSPELIVALAANQLQAARSLMKEVNSTQTKDLPLGTARKRSRSCQLCQACDESVKGPWQSAISSVSVESLNQMETRLRGRAGCEPSPSMDSSTTQGSVADASAPWTLDQAFFAIMGGYTIIDPSSPDRQLALTPPGLLFLAKVGLIPRLPRVHVADKSNANGMAKVLVCLQASFLVVQVLARLRQGLDITLLEIHTSMHVICALVLYLLWFHKPYDVLVPATVTDEEALDITALWTLDWRLKDESWFHLCYAAFERGTVFRNDPPPTECTGALNLPHTVPPNHPAHEALGRLPQDRRHFSYHVLGPTRIHRIAQRLEFDDQYLATRVHNLRRGTFLEPIPGLSERANLEGIGDPRRITQMALLALFSSLYGAGYLTGWAASFPTTIEQSLWRGSALLLSSLWVIWLIGFMGMFVKWRLRVHLSKRMGESHLGTVGEMFNKHGTKVWPEALCWLGINVTANVVNVSFGVVFALARLFFLVEAFASLRCLPAGAFSTVSWLDFWPHL